MPAPAKSSAAPSYAPGWPGIEPRWTSSAKIGVGTALNSTSRVWFTLSHGIFNEIYYPQIDQACTRDMGLIVTNGRDFFSDEKRDARCALDWLEAGIPAFRLTNTHHDGRYRIEKEILADPRRDAVMQHTRFIAQQGVRADYHLYVLLAPHLDDRGRENTAWIGEHAGVPLLFAQRGERALALACSVPRLKRSAGFVGTSDGWQDLEKNKRMTWEYGRAENGNVALTAEVDLSAGDGEFLLTLGFGLTPAEAARCALASLADGMPKARTRYVREWREWQRKLTPPAATPLSQRDLLAQTLAVLRVHQSKELPGGIIASLAIPWGFARDDGDIGGYHMVWTRDLVETSGALLAVGANDEVKHVLAFLERTQDQDGHWPQNMWIDGTPYWNGVQLDETAFPILLVDMAWRAKVLDDAGVKRLWVVVQRAAGYLLRNGPVTAQDRWEEDPGYSPFTLGATIAALLAAADIAELNGHPAAAAFLRETADFWNDSIERWTYVRGTGPARQVGVDGYYVRIAPPEAGCAVAPAGDMIAIKNQLPSQSDEPAAQIISPDALALVRFGLRAASDPRIVNTVKVIDALLKVETPNGPAWHRYNDDGYGEHADGSPFDGTGIGRLWPLLTGERAHYELAAGRPEEAARLLRSIEAMANQGGFIPEQVWDSPDLPERELFFGQPSGSAMPLVWAHGEYLKLRRSLADGKVYDLPPQTARRYVQQKTASPLKLWRFNQRCGALVLGKTLRVEVLAAAVVRWTDDDWRTSHDTTTREAGFGFHVACLSNDQLALGRQIEFTFHWIEADRWEGENFTVTVTAPAS
jgi:glucoamylase